MIFVSFNVWIIIWKEWQAEVRLRKLIALLLRIGPIHGNASDPVLKGSPLTLSNIPGPLAFQRRKHDLFDILFLRHFWLKCSNCSEWLLALIIQASFALHLLILLLTSSIFTTGVSRRNDAGYVFIVHMLVQIVNVLFVICLFFAVLHLFCLFLKLIICVLSPNQFVEP